MIEVVVFPAFASSACFIDFKHAFSRTNKRFFSVCVYKKLNAVVRGQSPGSQAVCSIEMRGTFDDGAATDSERAEQQVQRRTDHLDEVAAISDLLAKIGKRTEGVN